MFSITDCNGFSYLLCRPWSGSMAHKWQTFRIRLLKVMPTFPSMFEKRLFSTAYFIWNYFWWNRTVYGHDDLRLTTRSQIAGLQESTNEPARTFSAHPDKIYIVRFHPTASDLLTTAAHDLTVKIWDLSVDPPTAAITLTGHTDQIFALDWSPCGEFLATVCKDGLVRVSAVYVTGVVYSPVLYAMPETVGQCIK